MINRRPQSPIAAILALLICCTFGYSAASAQKASKRVQLAVKIIHATKGKKHIDPKLKSIAGKFADLAFTSYKLLDEAIFNLEVGSSGKMEFPGKRWLEVTYRGSDAKKMALVDLAVKKIKFSAKVRIPKGGILAIGGPRHQEGVLLLAVTAKTPKP